MEHNVTATVSRDWVHRIVRGAVKDAIIAHGPITKNLIGSVTKRVTGRIYGELAAKEKHLEHAN